MGISIPRPPTKKASRPLLPDERAAQSLLSQVPPSWAEKLREKFKPLIRQYGRVTSAPIVREYAGEVAAMFHQALPPNATDADINDHAAACARRVRDIISLPVQAHAVRESLDHHCINNNIAPPVASLPDHSRVARMLDPHWWRRGLRRAHAREIESVAIRLGMVHAHASKYVSKESFERRAQQNRRNRKMLENTTLTNENGEQFTLAQLSDKSVANPRLRRGELMLRVRGFEDIARGRGDECLFITLTCPSRFHAKLQASGEFNPHYDGSTPGQGQLYLRGVWSRIRSSCHRKGISIYGFRIAEPHHDGCPHWHLLLFVHRVEGGSSLLPNLQCVVQDYALADSPNEPGAQERRVRFEPIDLKTGSAAGYVAKYIAKAVGVEEGASLSKRDSHSRIPAWAATHGIRQFQQIGGAPVGLWRELRKVPYAHIKRSKKIALIDSWQAANRTDQSKCDFSAFLAATGGVAIKRRERKLLIAREFSAKPGRYGEPLGWLPVGVRVAGRQIFLHRCDMPGGSLPLGLV